MKTLLTVVAVLFLTSCASAPVQNLTVQCAKTCGMQGVDTASGESADEAHKVSCTCRK